MGRIHQQGDKIPNGIKWWYILYQGHFVQKIDLSDYVDFPYLENPAYVYTSAG